MPKKRSSCCLRRFERAVRGHVCTLERIDRVKGQGPPIISQKVDNTERISANVAEIGRAHV